MARLRYNGLTATLNSTLSAGATSISFNSALTHSAGVAVPTLSGGDYIALSIFNSSRNLAEIVHLTAYTSGATTGTILRAQEGTSAVAHSQNSRIVHAANADDFAAVVGEVSDHIDDASGAHAASAISFSPTGSIAATNVQAAVAEVASEAATALAAEATARDAAIGVAVANLVDSAPGTLDTLNELAAALGDDPNLATTLSTAIGARIEESVLDANSILYAVTDDTPAALAVPASRIVGRKASGDISAMTAAELWALLAAGAGHPEVLVIAISDETTAITTGTAKVTFRMPFAMTLTAVRASLTTASTSGNPAFDLNEAGVSVFSTTLTIDANEKTSTTAATPAVISDASLADDAEMTIDIDTAGTGAKGAKLYLIGTRA